VSAAYIAYIITYTYSAYVIRVCASINPQNNITHSVLQHSFMYNIHHGAAIYIGATCRVEY
jgi:hypothetical protein